MISDNPELIDLLLTEFREVHGAIINGSCLDADLSDMHDMEVRRRSELELNKAHVIVQGEMTDRDYWAVSVTMAWSIMYAWKASISAIAPGRRMKFSILGNVFHYIDPEIGVDVMLDFGLVAVIRVWSECNDPENELDFLDRRLKPDSPDLFLQSETGVEEYPLSEVFDEAGNYIPAFFQAHPHILCWNQADENDEEE